MDEKILVIKLSALGDFIQALGPMRAIREHHKKAAITLLTTKAFEKMARNSGYFDHIEIDVRPKLYQPSKILKLHQFLNRGFDRAYDLQNNDRTNMYFRLLNTPKPEWVGIAKGATHENRDPLRSQGLAFEGHVQTLAKAGIERIEIDTLEWMDAYANHFKMPKNYALLVTGSAPSRPEKRWSEAHFTELAKSLKSQNIEPVLIGAHSEEASNAKIESASGALNLTGKTTIEDIASLARRANYIIGNDTGPTHIAAVTGTPTLVLFKLAKSSNPKKHRPLGKSVTVLANQDLDTITPQDVLSALDSIDRTKAQ